MKRLFLIILLLLPSLGAREKLSDEEVLRRLSIENPASRAIEKGLAFLRSHRKSSGFISDTKYTATHTSLTLMAHLSCGITFQDPEHGVWMRRALQAVLDHQESNGYFGKKDGSRMYGHGITTLMLTESLGMLEDPHLESTAREATSKALQVILYGASIKKNKEHQGGWRYHPDAKDSDLSLSGWQLLSLHSAQQVGFRIPEKVIQGALAYADRLIDDEGKVGYQKRGQDSIALRGLALLVLEMGKEEASKKSAKVATRMKKQPFEWKGPHCFYRAYYDAVGLARANPKLWRQIRKNFIATLVKHQAEDGSWPSPPGDNESKHGRVYTASMALLALAVDRHVLPAYQR